MKRFGWLFLMLGLLSLLASTAFAQTAVVTGTIRGTVTDQSGAVIGGADVTVTNTGTGRQRSVKSSPSGEYVVPDLPAGGYTISVKMAGFEQTMITGIDLHVASTAEVNAKMNVGQTSETITVEGVATQVETSSAQLGETVDSQQVRELPLNGENFFGLTLLSPGVTGISGPGGSVNTKDKGLLGGVDIAVNGNPSTNNLFLLDGANDNDKGSNRTILIYPAVDSIAEFKMLRNSYGPEYGQASGAVISIVTKSGENTWHGSANYFGRNDALNSFEYFAAQGKNPLTGKPQKDELRRNDYGYTIGGPIKKDKAFFFFSEDWNKEIRGFTHHACEPIAAELGGDFSGGAGGVAPDGCGPIPNLTGFETAPGSGIIANPDPAGLAYDKFLPVANQTVPINGQNYFLSIPTKINWREESVKVDYNLTPKEILTGRYTHNAWSNPAPHVPGAYWGDTVTSAQLQGNWDQPSQNAIGKLTSTLGSNMVNEAQFSYSHNAINTSPGGLASNPAGIVAAINAAVPTVYPSNVKQKGGVPIFWSGFQQYDNAETTWLISPYSNSMDTYTINDDFSKVQGSHTFKAGFLWGYSGKNEDQNGGFDQPAAATADWGVITKATGNGLANLLIPGQVFSGVNEFSTNPTDHARWHDLEFYAGDTWKATRNLTVEYGARWSLYREPYDLNNDFTSFSAAAYDPTKPATDACNGIIIVPGTNPCGAANQLNGTSYSSGTPGVNRSLKNNSNHAIAPRLGVAWDVRGDGKTAVRAGVGQFYQRERVTPQVLLSSNAPFSTNSTVNRSLDVAPPLAGVAASPSWALDPRAILPNSWQWNLTVEQELARNTTLEIGYVGNRGIHLTNKFDLNQVLPANRTAAAFTAGNVAAFRPLSNDGGIVEFARDAGASYHALQVLFRSRLKDRAQIQAAYTWSHSIADTELDDSSGGTSGSVVSSLFTDLTNTRLDRGSSTINRPHVFVANAIVFLPKLGGSNNFVKQVLGGWEYSVIGTATSGNSLTVFDNGVHDDNPPIANALQTLSGTGYAANQRPNVTGIACNSGEKGPQIINPAAFTLTGFSIGSIGNESRGYCHGPDQVNADMGLYKNWNITERVKLQFRIDGFNAFNHAQFQGASSFFNTIYTPNVTCGANPCSSANNVVQTTDTAAINPSFGKSTGTRGPRELQYGLKVYF